MGREFFGLEEEDYIGGEIPLTDKLTVAIAMLGFSDEILVEAISEHIAIKPATKLIKKGIKISPQFIDSLVNLAIIIPNDFSPEKAPPCLGNCLKLLGLSDPFKKEETPQEGIPQTSPLYFGDNKVSRPSGKKPPGKRGAGRYSKRAEK